MSRRNGDKARFDKARMKKIRHREHMRAVRKATESGSASKTEPKSR